MRYGSCPNALTPVDRKRALTRLGKTPTRCGPWLGVVHRQLRFPTPGGRVFHRLTIGRGGAASRAYVRVVAKKDRDEDYGLTPREWLDSDPVPLTPDIDFNDPEQRIAWIRANNEEKERRQAELDARRSGRAPAAGRDADRAATPLMSTTTVVGVRILNAEQRALVRVARREGVTVSDLVRRWVRAGLEVAYDAAPDPPDPDDRESQREVQRAALRAAADDVVGRITDELRRLREMVAAAG